MSKLQALAAARKKKAQEQKSGSSLKVETPMSDLSISQGNQDQNGARKSKQSSPESATLAQKQPSRGFPLRKRKDSNPHEKSSKAPPVETESEQSGQDRDLDTPAIDQAQPSAFASTMFGSKSNASPRQPANIFTMPYVETATTPSADPFAGPSPDDVVIAAQSKGSTISTKPKK